MYLNFLTLSSHLGMHISTLESGIRSKFKGQPC